MSIGIATGWIGNIRANIVVKRKERISDAEIIDDVYIIIMTAT
jgi:hypothetical protein